MHPKARTEPADFFNDTSNHFSCFEKLIKYSQLTVIELLILPRHIDFAADSATSEYE